jgi:PKD repeat protein
MLGRTHKLKTLVVTVAMVLATFIVMASSITRDEVTACAGVNQQVDVGESVHLDGGCSIGVGTLSYKWFFGDGDVGYGVEQDHVYDSIGPSGDEGGVYYTTLVVKDGNNVYDLDTVKITVRNYYPNADAGSNQVVDEDDTVWFDNSGSWDTNNDIVSTNWDYGDGTDQNVALNNLASNVYEKEGAYPVTLTVTDNDGAYDEDVIMVTVNNVVPSANGVADGDIDDDITITEDDTVSFDATGSSDTPSDQPSLKYGWDYGDGNKEDGIATTHTYTKKGTYTVTLTVTDDDDAYDQDTIIVRVINAPPVADANVDQVVDEGDTIFFDATGSYDTPSDEPILDYSWSFGDKGTLPTHNWWDDSVNNVDLVVTDDDGLQDMDSMTVTVDNVPPNASIDEVYVLVDFTLRVSGEKWHNVIVTISEPNVEIQIIEIIRYPGSPNDQAITAEDVKINIAEQVNATVYYTPWDDPINGSPNGADPVWLTMGFEDGVEYTLMRPFNVQKPEEWTWVHDMNAHVAGHPVHFEASVYDPGTDDIATEWDFGDGTAIINNNYISGGQHPMVIWEHYVHTFPWGSYTVDFEAADDDGGSDSMSVTVTNTDFMTCTNVAPRANSSGGKTVVEDEVFTLIGVGKDTGSDQPILTYTWDMQDGTIYNTPNVTHAYKKSGTYYPTLVVADDDGEKGITSQLVEVLNVVPTAVANADQTNVEEDDVINFDAFSSTDTPTDLSIMEYGWDYGDGSKDYGIATTHVYSKTGTYYATLTTTDDNGAFTTHTLTMEVQNVVPHNPVITAEGTVDEDEVVFFEVTVEDTPSDVPLLEYDWDFDDGSTGTGMNPTHAYSTPGDYTVLLRVTDDDMDYIEEEFHITVENVVPIPYGGLRRSYYGPVMSVLFHGRGFDSHTDQPSLTYKWEFGDGASSNSAITSHIYPTDTAQTYIASLKVTDMHGDYDTYYVVVNVKVDSDGDQLLNGVEDDIGTDPFDFDTDDDWLIDYYELYPPGGKPTTDPTKADEDRDGCTDWEEIWPGRDGYITDPHDPDMDGDTIKDCDEVFAKTYKSTQRHRIGSYWTASGDVDVSLSGIRSSSPASQIITAEAKVGISHTYIGELVITLGNGARDIVLRDREGGSADNLFESYDLFAEGFPASDFTSTRTWTLNVDDEVGSNEKGFVEYFEIYILSATDPTDADTDNDGLRDNEETNLGDDGWYTDPWKSDTDGDGVSDLLETTGWRRTTGKSTYQHDDGFKTDPTRDDTDRDEVDDYDDWDPLNNMMMEVDLGNFTPHDDDTGTLEDDSEVFVGISVGIYDYDEGKTLWTNRKNIPEDETRDLNKQYTFEVDDGDRYHYVIISAWDDDDITADDVLDIYPGEPNAWGGHYDLIQGTPNDAGDDENCYSISGNGDGYDTDEDASMEWCIRTVRPQRVKTVLLNSTDSQALYRADDGKYRYVGEQEFYYVLLSVTSGGSAVFNTGYNVIIVPRAVFTNSSLYWELDDASPPSYIGNLEFTAYDESVSWTAGSLVGTLKGSVSGANADNILWHLKHNADSDVIAESRTVTSQLVTLNLEDYVLNLIPFRAVEFDATGEDPDDFWESVGEFFVSLVEAIGDFFIAIFDFLVRLVTFIIEIGMWIIGKIIDAISAVIDAIIFVIETIIDFVVGVVQWVIDIIVNELLPLLKSVIIDILTAIGGPVFKWIAEEIIGNIIDALGYVLTWIAEDFLPGVADMVKAALNAGAALFDIVTGFAECVGELTLEALGDEVDGACRGIMEALIDFGESITDILVEALKIAGSALATVAAIILDWCGAFGGARSMTANEIAEAQPIFGSSIDYTKVRLADATPCTEFVGWIQGLAGERRPFTMGYVITITNTGTWNDTILIHELTHVWQYVQEGMDYVMDSIVEQIDQGQAAYNYGYDNAYDGTGGEEELNNSNGNFDDFNVEQQAQIIEHYYVRRYVEGYAPALYAAWQPYANVVFS